MRTLFGWIGVELDAVSRTEKLVSLAGGLVSILVVVLISQSGQTGGGGGAGMVIGSMGATAVLLFAVPHGQLSQPWPVVGGHTISALIGVVCARYVPNATLAAGCAVGLAIGAMHQFKCIHPPGGATALTAVVGGQGVAALGYGYVWNPILLNALAMVGLAVAFNYLFKWRRYPAFWNPRRPPARAGERDISHQEVVEALRSLDSFVDITEDDLIRLCNILSTRQEHRNGRN